MEFKSFMDNYKNKEIKKEELINILKSNFNNIIIDDTDEFNLVITLDKQNYQIQHTYSDNNSKSIIILDTSIIAQISPMHKL